MDIIKEIGLSAVLEQLAEECAELGHAALKLARIIRGENPTPKTRAEAEAMLQEESTDVLLCLRLLIRSGLIGEDEGQRWAKKLRWMKRIEESREESE